MMNTDVSRFFIGHLTTDEVAALIADPRPLIALLPVGSVEPHGPHMGLETDTAISLGACRRAVTLLEARGLLARIAPPVAYGVTECASGFAGAVSVAADVLTSYLHAVASGYLRTGFDHVCVVNNHLEPTHDSAVRAAVSNLPMGETSVACPLTRRWARTLSDEFKSGACHAGQYETSMIMATAPHLLRDDIRCTLPKVSISLAEQLRSGVNDFRDMGLTRAYAGDPGAATLEEGEAQMERLAEMIATEVVEALARRAGDK